MPDPRFAASVEKSDGWIEIRTIDVTAMLAKFGLSPDDGSGRAKAEAGNAPRRSKLS
jgi:hypothetical protein